MTDGVVETPHGAHFTECVPDYPRDEAFQRAYTASAKSDEAWDEFRARYIDVTEAEYQQAVQRMRDGPPTRAEVCAAAIADCFAHDGEILANPIGTLPVIGGRLAKATVAPELVMTDGEALLVENIIPIGVDNPEKVVAGWNPYRTMFDVVWSGRRHVMMSGSQIDKCGNQNFAFIGSLRRAPHAAARDARRARATRSTTRRRTGSRRTRTRTFVPSVDVVSGVGYDRAARAPGRRRPVPQHRPASSRTSASSTSRHPTTACACARCTRA